MFKSQIYKLKMKMLNLFEYENFTHFYLVTEEYIYIYIFICHKFTIKKIKYKILIRILFINV